MLKTKDAAAAAGVSASFLNKLRCTGGGPKYAKIGRAVRYDRSDIAAWLEERKIGGAVSEQVAV